jgi:hypothetical protein
VEKASQSSPSGTSSRPVSAGAGRSAATYGSRFGQRKSNRPCLRDASTLPLTPLPVPSCGSRTSGGTTCVSATSSAAAADPRLSRSILSAPAARRRRHSHRILNSESSVAPLSIEARAPGRALSALRPGVASRRGTSGASTASALGLCAQPAYTRFVPAVTKCCLRRSCLSAHKVDRCRLRSSLSLAANPSGFTSGSGAGPGSAHG